MSGTGRTFGLHEVMLQQFPKNSKFIFGKAVLTQRKSEKLTCCQKWKLTEVTASSLDINQLLY